MDDVVPGALQRLRASDIMRMAGLTVASLGQEYCRIGAVQATKREGAKLSGVVVVNGASFAADVFPLDDAGKAEKTEGVTSEKRSYSVAVEVQDTNTWNIDCTCSTLSPAICAHATALLYQWLTHPTKFLLVPSTFSAPGATAMKPPVSIPAVSFDASQGASARQQPNQVMGTHTGGDKGEGDVRGAMSKLLQTRRPLAASAGPKPLGDMLEMLFQLGLGELRGMAREYEITTTGLSKQELGEAILETLKQPDAVRRVVGTLDKPQRQLLATLTLAGGSITDDDLRSLYERFSFGQPDTLQHILLALQGKGLLFRTSFNSSLQQRLGFGGSLLDIGWHVPAEVRSALRIHVPATPFRIDIVPDGDRVPPKVLIAQEQELLPALLLVTRVLDGYRLERDDEKEEHNPLARTTTPLPTTGRNSGTLYNDQMGTVPPPENRLSASMLDTLQEAIPQPRAFLRFVARLLRGADILRKDDQGTPYLRALPNAARLFLGADSKEVIPDLFDLWLTRASYEELYDLQEEGLHLYSRTTPLNQPLMRLGELETENSEARQAVVRLLAQAPLNSWMNFAAFARFMYKLNPLFLQKRQHTFSSPHWWVEQEKGQILRPTQPADWMRVEGRYLAQLIQGPLHWWGITDVALSESGNLLAFRLTPVADWLLRGTLPREQGYGDTGDVGNASDAGDAGLSAVLPSVTATEQGALLVSCEVAAWPLIHLLEDFAEPASVLHGQLCYRLSPKCLSQALSRGQQPTVLFTLLRRIAAEQSTGDEGDERRDSALSLLLAQLERWAANYGRVRLYTDATLLEVADAMVMRELTATTTLHEHVVQAIHPLQLLLKKHGAAQLTEELKRRGQTPLLHEEEYYGAE
jgi:hypothetical protein